MIPLVNILSLLPQTQCEQCGYKGCKPYAKALQNNEADINLCVPGGEDTMQALAKVCGQEPQPVAKPPEPRRVARIIEDECIGCTKCIKACPVDAIVGSGKKMHTIISSACTGCDLCLPVCPTHCIEMDEVKPIQTASVINNTTNKERADISLERTNLRQERILRHALRKKEKDKKHQSTLMQDAIAACIARAKSKDNQCNKIK